VTGLGDVEDFDGGSSDGLSGPIDFGRGLYRVCPDKFWCRRCSLDDKVIVNVHLEYAGISDFGIFYYGGSAQ
jgi:hypothetical protein